MSYGPLSIFLSAGELSGDQYGADLARALLKLHPTISLSGMGGQSMRSAGVRTLVDSDAEGSLMGFWEVAKSLHRVRGAFRRLEIGIERLTPAALILIDYPEFNLRLARAAHSRGIPVLYYITPKLWVWRPGRVKWFQRYINHAAVIFPFETRWFKDHNWHHATFVGHPLVDSIASTRLNGEARRAFFQKWDLDEGKPLLALFPGSRKQEIERHAATAFAAAAQLRARAPHVQVVTCRARSVPLDWLHTFPNSSAVKIIDADPVQLMLAADAGLLKSGTTNLQAALAELPFTMFYKTGRISAAIARKLVRIKEYSIVNLISSGTVREIIQEEVTENTLCDEAYRLLFDSGYRKELLHRIAQIRPMLQGHHKLAGDSVPERVAALALKLAANGKSQ